MNTTDDKDAPFAPNGWLCEYYSGNTIRPATCAEAIKSREAAKHDGGPGVISVDGRSYYVQD